MAIIDVSAPSDNMDKKTINDIIDYSLSMTYEIRDYIQTAPIMLDGYYVLRSIMRMAKRGILLNKAIEKCLEENPEICPPPVEDENEPNCDNNCKKCWRRAIDRYAEKYNNEPLK